ncbi:molybdopterin-guanine dinucleotide biosynthesis protein A [Parvularcula bermudensis HTCC2503]|uniref:Molybdenum cofactor guanylyltransferase n=1 Tax=Parvularcula bermudensis (strain ATCC BAA-594 / HTCC2503 / KCTC 12087) TaxID=314260 RepID=E0THG6_PARBH|nr:molybdenum cofactor guanylyltransferase [Parvularcula bermudensis]ADM10758.1 molybdopterin-guanine dinucleotide biosynthesis protein A [Parvularcula bermudensis HTCC2503]
MTNGQINPPSPPTTFGVIFMGGESRRLGQEKASVELAGMTLLDRIVDRLSPQCAQLALSVRRAGDGLEGLDEVVDPVTEKPGGPLMGVLAALRWARGQGARFLLTSPVDTPFLPTDLADRLRAEMSGHRARSAVAVSRDRIHGLTALYGTDLLPDVERLVLQEDERMLQAFHLRIGSVPTVFATTPTDPFININTPEDLAAARALIGENPSS